MQSYGRYGFVVPPGAPPGLLYRENAATPEQWQEMHTWLVEDASIPWEVATEGRRVAQWGYRYDYCSHKVDPTPVQSIPLVLTQLLHGEPEPELFTQCIINEYGADDGIPWHKDDAAFGNTVLVFSFGEPRTLRLRRLASGVIAAQAPGDPEAQAEQPAQVLHGWECIPAHCSAYVLQGEARIDYQHSVLAGKGRRHSVTFRSSDRDHSTPTRSSNL